MQFCYAFPSLFVLSVLTLALIQAMIDNCFVIFFVIFLRVESF